MDSELMLTAAVVHLAAVSSPGPNLILTAHYAMSERRGAALGIAAGLSLASLTLAFVSVTGLTMLLTSHPLVATGLGAAGALYLAWIGVRLLHTAVRPRRMLAVVRLPAPTSITAAVGVGYFSNLVNPKTLIYYTSLFGTLIPPQATHIDLVGLVAVATTVSAVWWGATAILLAQPRARPAYDRVRRPLSALFGVGLIILGGTFALRLLS